MLPSNTSDRRPKSVIIVDDHFKLTPLRASMIAFYLHTMVGERQFKNNTEFVQTFSQTFNVTERGCWYAWKLIKPLIPQIRRAQSKLIYFAFRLDGFDSMVRQFITGKGLL